MVTTMKKLLFAATTVGCFAITGCKKDNEDMTNPTPTPPTPATNQIFYGLTSSNQLIQYNANAVNAPMNTMDITGLGSGENIIGIDFRPATGQLYGVSDASKLYIIHHGSGVATMLGSSAFSPSIEGDYVGFDFNPTVDRIRLVTNEGQNLRLHPETGAVAATDGSLNPNTPWVSAAAYTNSYAGATSTVLFDIDAVDNRLVKQDPPNDGVLVNVGALGIEIASGTDVSFDISPDNSVALATITVGTTKGLYKINLTTGMATSLGSISADIIGIAIPTNPVAYATDASNNLHIFNPTMNQTPITKSITGLQADESIVGIDMRPATGQLFAMGSTSRLYTINTASGAATAIGTGPFGILLGTSFGFDFNPSVDRIRVVSNTGQNLRLNPNDGALVATDGNLNPGTPIVSAAAYTNNIPAASSTVLHVIDTSTDMLYQQIPPNDGVLVPTGSLGINVDAENGFDIGGATGNAYAVLSVSGTSKLYKINLSSGMATEQMTLPASVKAFALGVGF